MNKKAMILILASLAALTVMFSCGSNADGGKTDVTSGQSSADTTAAETTAPETEAVDANGYKLDSLGTKFNYNGKTVNILFDKAQLTKTLTEDLNGEIVNDALFNRLSAVKDRLGVSLNFIALEGAWAKRAEFAAEVARVVNAGTGDYDLVCAYNLTPPTMAVNGTLTNLYDLDYPEFDQPWWPKNLLEQSLVNDKLFFCSDNSSWNVIRNMDVIVYNSRLVGEYNLGDPMDYVLDGSWTMDKLKTLIKDTYKDLNGNNNKDTEDQYGLASDTNPRIDGYFYAAGLTITTFDSTGTPVMNLGGENVVNFVSDMCKLYKENPDVTIDSKQYQMFKAERAVFYETAVAIADQKLEFDYGVLPLPKFDESQTDYITGMSNTHDSWCVPVGVKDAEMSGAVLEALASEAYRQVAPAYFETALKLKYSSSSKAGQVYDLIRAGMTFDFGYVYGNNFTTAPFILVRNCIVNNTPDWSSIWAAQKDVYSAELTKILTALKNN